MGHKAKMKKVSRGFATLLVISLVVWTIPPTLLAHEGDTHVSNPGIIPAAQGNPAMQNANLLQAMQPVSAALNTTPHLPHGGNPGLQAEHDYVFNYLVTPSMATHQVIKSGNLDDPTV